LGEHLFNGYAVAQADETIQQGAALFITDFELF
jgi:hypothetical protein